MVRANTQARQPVRREGNKELPAGPKALKTRAALLDAATELFGEQGYQETTVGQIAERAGVALGTFYQYFRDRQDIMRTIVTTSVAGVLRVDARWDPARGRNGLRRVVGAFVRFYANTAAFQAVWEEVMHLEPEMADLRREHTRLFTEAVSAALTDGMRTGLIRADVDADGAARALTAMVDRYCYLTYVFDPPNGRLPSPEETAELLTDLWADAVRLKDV